METFANVDKLASFFIQEISQMCLPGYHPVACNINLVGKADLLTSGPL